METKTNGRVQRSAAEWQEILNRFAESGRSRAAFCRSEGIAPATFDVWQRKLGAKKAAKKAAREFVEVRPVSVVGLGGCWQVEIELPPGRSPRFGEPVRRRFK